MIDYRLYALQSDGRISERLEFVAGDDEAAIALSRTRFPHSPAAESWRGNRIVFSFERVQRAGNAGGDS